MAGVTVLSPDAAATAVEQAETAAAHWTAQASGKARDADRLAAGLAEARAKSGDDLLDAADPDAVSRIAAELVRLQTEQDVAVRAAEAARERLTGARRDVLRARAASIYTRVSLLRDAAASRAARTDQILAELAGWERVTYAPVRRDSALGLVGQTFVPQTLTQTVLGRAAWLDEYAADLARVADSGADEQVASKVAVAVPDVLEVETAVVPDLAV